MEEAKMVESGAVEEVPDLEEESYGWDFHKWPFLIAAVITVLLYAAVWLLVDREPPYIDPADLPLPPGSF